MSSILVNVDNQISLGRKIRLARVARGWSQVAVAVLARCKQDEVSRLERDISIKPKARQRILKTLELQEEK